MTTETQPPFSWIRQIPGDLLRLDEKPLLGFPPSYDWHLMSAKVKESLQFQSFSINPGEWTWRSADDLFSGLGKEILGLPIAVVPLSGDVYWVMPQQEIRKLMNTCLSLEGTSQTEAIDQEYLKTFYRFLAVEAINAFQKTTNDSKLSPSIAGDFFLPSEDSLSIDIHFNANGRDFFGRLFLSKEFKTAWRQRYLTEQNAITSNSPLVDSLSVMVHMEAGRLTLKLSEWKQVKTGDFLFLDTCSLDPDEDKGRVMLTINGHPFFRARLKQGSIKILEHPLYHEADTVMDDKTNSHDEDEDIFSDDDLDFSLDEQTAESSSEGQESSSDFEISDEDLDLSDESLGLTSAANDTKETTILEDKKESDESHIAATNAPAAPASIEDIDLPVIIELGRVQMTVRKLLELQPGNMLDLNIHPESGVDLIVNGKRIARGELLRIGETLGVRIQELS